MMACFAKKKLMFLYLQLHKIIIIILITMQASGMINFMRHNNNEKIVSYRVNITIATSHYRRMFDFIAGVSRPSNFLYALAV